MDTASVVGKKSLRRVNRTPEALVSLGFEVLARHQSDSSKRSS
jgi:hypothetical protein